MSVTKIPALIKSIYSAVAELEQLFPNRKFTPDGILVGSIGEVLAAHHYELKLLPQNNAKHDALCPKGRRIQIKTTQRNSIDIRTEPEHLLVIKLHPDGTCEEVYNGSGAHLWKLIGEMPIPKVGFYTISFTKLKKLASGISEAEKIKRVRA